VSAGLALDCSYYSHHHYARFEPFGIRSTLLQKPYC
jgi:hypothetical protein